MRPSDTIDEQERRRMITEAAYFRAERRGFKGSESEEVQDWFEAECEVDERIRRLEIEGFVNQLEDALLTANKRITALRKRAAALTAKARAECEQDIEQLATLRDTLRPTLREIRSQGERTSQELREQAEKRRQELVSLGERVRTARERGTRSSSGGALQGS